jgi:hypothetical protein
MLNPQQTTIKACLELLPNSTAEEAELVADFLDQSRSLDQHIAYPRSQAGHGQLVSTQMLAASPCLKDAICACAIILKQLQVGTVMHTDMSSCVKYISKGMDALRLLRVLSSEDTVLCHTLGGLLALSISAAIGVGVPEICRYCLSTTTLPVGTTVSYTDTDPWKSFLILLEIMDCLVYRQKPISNMGIMDSTAIDCRLGLCLPLLPYFHDLCVISNSILHATEASVLARLQQQLDDIHSIVEPWQPPHLDKLLEQFDWVEIVHLLAQSKIYRLGALLLSHRLRFPFGQQDAQAEIWSNEVMMELEITQRVTKRSMRFVTLPFIIAAVEVRDQGLRSKTLDRVDDCVDHYAPLMQMATKTFLSRIWHERDFHLTTRWFDSIHKPCPVLASINADCFGG